METGYYTQPEDSKEILANQIQQLGTWRQLFQDNFIKSSFKAIRYDMALHELEMASTAGSITTPPLPKQPLIQFPSNNVSVASYPLFCSE